MISRIVLYSEVYQLGSMIFFSLLKVNKWDQVEEDLKSVMAVNSIVDESLII